MASTNLFVRIFSRVDGAMTSYVANTSADVIAFLTPIFTSLLIIWIAIWGYMTMFGRSQEPLQEGVFRIIRIGFIMALGLTVGTYNGVTVDFLAGWPQTLASIVTGTPTGTSAAQLDGLFSQVFAVAEAAWDKGGIMNGNFGMYLISWGILLVGGGLCLITAFFILLSKVMTTVLLAIGPVFIVLLLFQSTQRFFESWLGMVINFGVILVLAAAIGRLMVELGNSYISTQSGSDPGALANFADAAMLFIVFGLCILVMRQIPSVAAALGGGISLATRGAISSTMGALRPSKMQREYRQIQRDSRLVGNALASPGRAVGKTYAAYQKRFGSGNTIASA